MAFTSLLIGSAAGDNVTSLSIPVQSAVQEGGKIFVAVCINKEGYDTITDSAGNDYEQAAGSTTIIGAFLFRVDSNLRLAHGDSITLAYSVPFSARMAAIGISGLISGVIERSSAGQGNSTDPLVSLPTVPLNDWCISAVAVGGPSADGFTQDPTWLDPGNLNVQNTLGFSAYLAYKQNTQEVVPHILYQPHLGVARVWSALACAIAP